MKNHPKCPFQNRYMKSPCNSITLKNHNEWWCLKHGTITFIREAWDPVETPDETYESEMGGLSWSQDEITKLIELDDRGVDLLLIARALGRTRGAVYSKIWSLKESKG